MNYQDILNQEYRKRWLSARDTKEQFSKDIGLSPSFLSRVLKGKRHLSEEKAYEVAQRLWKSPLQIDNFCKKVRIQRSKSESLQQHLEENSIEISNIDCIQLNTFRGIYQWQNIAIIELLNLPSFKLDFNWIAKKLNIHPMLSEIAVERLLQHDIICKNENKLKPKNLKRILKGTPSKPIRMFHDAMLKKAQKALHEQSFEQRSITGTMMAIDSKNLKEANKMINEFRLKLASFLTETEEKSKDSIYYLNINLFRVDEV